MTRADKAARDLQERFSLEEPFIDPEKIAIELGVTVIRQEADGRISGMLLRRNNRDVIGVNPIKSQTVQRFVLAHLLGHHQLHRTRPTSTATSPSSRSRGKQERCRPISSLLRS